MRSVKAAEAARLKREAESRISSELELVNVTWFLGAFLEVDEIQYQCNGKSGHARVRDGKLILNTSDSIETIVDPFVRITKMIQSPRLTALAKFKPELELLGEYKFEIIFPRMYKFYVEVTCGRPFDGDLWTMATTWTAMHGNEYPFFPEFRKFI